MSTIECIHVHSYTHLTLLHSKDSITVFIHVLSYTTNLALLITLQIPHDNTSDSHVVILTHICTQLPVTQLSAKDCYTMSFGADLLQILD